MCNPFILTRNQLLNEREGVEREGLIYLEDGSVWEELPSENGNGWYLGEVFNPDHLLFAMRPMTATTL